MGNLGVSVVSGTFNRLPLLKDMIASARASIPIGIPLEFIICDGGSTDGTLEWLKIQRDVVLIEDGELLGAISAFTRAAKLAKYPYVVLSNDDIQFRGDAILRALLHLETHLSCGAVAFADNRPSPGKSGYAVMPMPAMLKGVPVSVNYAQVGLVRTWLGNDIGWWGADDDTFPARTYAGDNYLSSGIWERGYTVDAVKGCEVDDSVFEDDLRELNGAHRPDGSHADSAAYFARYPEGAHIPPAPTRPNPDTERLRILYLPIYEPGHTIQKGQKHGLRDALAKRAWVQEIDFLGVRTNDLFDVLAGAIQSFKPHMIISQIQAPTPLTPLMVRQLRGIAPKIVWVNWNGDVWEGGLTSPEMLDMAKWFDLQLTVNADVLPVYAQHGILAAYWQIGFEFAHPNATAIIARDVVFLANAYTEQRKKLEDYVRGWGFNNSAFFGSGWKDSAGFNLYDFAEGEAIYRNAKIALGDNQFNKRGFVSNRLFQAMAAGYCLYMQQVVPGLEELTGLRHGEHYIAWKDKDDLRAKLVYYLENDTERQRIADAGTAYVREHHSFDARVNELFTSLLPLAKRRPREYVTLNYTGTRTKPFGVEGHGMFTPGESLRLEADDARILMLRQPGLWEQVKGEMV